MTLDQLLLRFRTKARLNFLPGFVTATDMSFRPRCKRTNQLSHLLLGLTALSRSAVKGRVARGEEHFVTVN